MGTGLPAAPVSLAQLEFGQSIHKDYVLPDTGAALLVTVTGGASFKVSPALSL